MPRNVLIDIIGVDKASPAFVKVGAAAEAAAGRVEKANARVGRAASVMTRGLTVPFLVAAGASVKFATDFNASMTKIQTQAGGTAKDVQTLSKQVLDLAKYTEQGPNELAKALYHLKSVGLDNVDAMHALRQASDLAAVGGADLESTTNALAGAWRTGIKGATDFHQAVSTVNAIIGAGNMSMQDFNDAIGTGILPTAKTFGLTLKDVGSALALFTDEGVPANAAATRLRMSFSLLGAPSAIAEKHLKTIGLTGLNLADDMRKPNGLIVAIGDLKKHLDASGMSASMQSQLLSHAFGGGRSSSAILSLINNYDVLVKKQQQVTASMGKFNNAVATQRKTPAAQFKLLEASLQRSAIILGNALLPSVIKLVHGITNAAEWFNHLSSGAKTFGISVLAIGAALGPVLVIMTRLVKIGALIFGAKGLTGAVRFIKGLALVNVALRTYETRAFSAGVATRSFVGSYGKGIGILGGGLATIALVGKQIADMVDAKTVETLGNLQSAWTDLNSALINGTDSVQKTRMQWARAQVDATGLAGKASLAGISISDLTSAIAHGGGEMTDLIHRWKQFGDPSSQTLFTLISLNKQFGAGTVAQRKYAAASVGSANAAEHAASATDHLATASHSASGSMKAAGLSAKQFANALQNIDGGALDAASANIQLRQGILGLKGAFAKNSDAIRGGSAAALQNRSALIDLIGTAKQHAAALKDSGASQKRVTTTLEADIAAIGDQAVKLGVSRTAWHALIAQMHLTPHDIETKLHADTVTAERNVQRLQDALAGLPREIGIHVSAVGQINVQGKGHLAAGGIVRGPGTGTSDTAGVYALSNGEAVIPARAVSRNPALVSSLIQSGRGMARGGITTSKVGGKKVWIYGGQQYASLMAAQNAEARDSKSNRQSANSKAQNLISGIGQSASPQFTIGGGLSASRLMAQITHAWATVPAKFRSQITRLVALANKQLSALHVKIRNQDLSAVKRALKGTAADLRAAFGGLLGDVHAAGGPDKLINRITAAETRLLNVQKQRARTAADLARAKGNYANNLSTGKSNALGFFDAGSAGANSAGRVTGGSFKAQQTQALNRIKAFYSGIKRLESYHVNPFLLSQIESQGPDALPQVRALLSLGRKGIGGINRTESQIQAYAKKIGVNSATYQDRGRIAALERREKSLDKRERELDKQLEDRIVHAMSGWKINIDAKGQARLVKSGTKQRNR